MIHLIPAVMRESDASTVEMIPSRLGVAPEKLAPHQPAPLFRPATEGDLRAWYGSLPGYTIKAWVLEVDGEVMGIGGLAYYKGRPNHLFTEWKPELKRFPLSMIKAMRRGLSELRGAPALARIHKDEPNAERISQMMGLTRAGVDQEGILYRWLS